MATSMVKNYGFSRKLGPVYYTDRDDIISPQTRERIDAEVRRCVYNCYNRHAVRLLRLPLASYKRAKIGPLLS